MNRLKAVPSFAFRYWKMGVSLSIQYLSTKIPSSRRSIFKTFAPLEESHLFLIGRLT